MKSFLVTILIFLPGIFLSEDWTCTSVDAYLEDITCISKDGEIFKFQSQDESTGVEYEVNEDLQLDIKTFIESIGPGKSIKASTPAGDFLTGITLEGGQIEASVKYANGESYEGNMTGAWRHGKGKYKKSEYILEGNFIDGYLQGYGIKTYLDRAKVTKGEFLYSALDGLIEDNETYIDENGATLTKIYKGQAKADLWHGFGLLEIKKITEYEGAGLGINEYSSPDLDARFWIENLVENSPASKSEIVVGDNIISIKNPGKPKQDSRYLTLPELVNMISGKKGRPIDLEILRYDKNNERQTFTVRLIRDKIQDVFTEVYEGRFVDGNRSGYGKSTTSDGKSYEGTWKNNNWDGFGKRTWGEGNHYLGTYKDGSCEGTGMQLNQNYDIVYYGEFHKCNAHGQGGSILHLPDGTKEIKNGQFFENQLDGYGEAYYANGNTYKGNWKKDKSFGYGEFYSSKFRTRYTGIFDENSTLQGKGTFKNDQNKYEGNFLDGYAHGEGKMYEKEFLNGKPTWSEPRFAVMDQGREVGTYEPEYALEEERVALVIGNGAYLSSRLENSVNDSAGIMKTLENKGFKVTHKTNLNQKDFKKAVWDFAEVVKNYDGNVTALFYYAGHAVQIDGDNYLVPVDSRMNQQRDIELESINAQSIINSLSKATKGVKILIMDACRNNPFKSYSRDISGGLAQISAPIGTFIAYSTAPGEVALDGTSEGYGIYTGNLINALNTPGLTIEQVFKRTRLDVANITNGQQIPWESSSLIGDFYFLED